MKTYDFNKAKKLISENQENLVSAYLGMHEDWFWTASSIWEEGEYNPELNPTEEGEITIQGIRGSTWATPTLRLIFNTKEERMVPCYAGESSDVKSPFFELGCISEKVQNNIPKLEN